MSARFFCRAEGAPKQPVLPLRCCCFSAAEKSMSSVGAVARPGDGAEGAEDAVGIGGALTPGYNEASHRNKES